MLLDGNDAFVEDSAALGSNSALTGLTNVAGSLDLEDGASLSTTGSLTDSGRILLDWVSGGGGSSLNVGGALTITGALGVGAYGLPSSDTAYTVTAECLRQ